VQAASGNTSIKVDGALWIKASGKWLADARTEGIFTCVEYSAEQWGPAAFSYATTSGLKPSIETAMHVTLPQKVVVHVHSVNTIAWAVRQDGQEQVARRLADLHWIWIPHVPSGVPLALEIRRALSRVPEANVFVLANHGLVVCGDSCGAAETLLREVEERLAIAPRAAPDPDCGKLHEVACAPKWKVPATRELHALGTDPVSRSILLGGVLFPCQAIFLEPSLTILERPSQVTEATDQPFYILEERGVVLSESITRAQYEMLVGLMEVVQRLDNASPIRYLSEVEVSGILNADAYRYRALVEAAPNSPC
jgi:rhamnose utilization protein RhaD (predicted bifunctional aldolase and dehydrogenase)